VLGTEVKCTLKPPPRKSKSVLSTFRCGGSKNTSSWPWDI